MLFVQLDSEIINLTKVTRVQLLIEDSIYVFFDSSDLGIAYKGNDAAKILQAIKEVRLSR